MSNLSRAFVFGAAALALGWTWALAGPTSHELILDNQAYQSEKVNFASPQTRQARAVAGIAAMLKPAVEKAYGAPFQYYTTTEMDPNAYSYFGPRVYVSTGMVNFAENREELAGVMCHESAHVLHHDGTESALNSGFWESIESKLKARGHKTIASLIAKGTALGELRYTRVQESEADKDGAHICSESGSNPWGLVWMLQHLQQRYPSSGLTFFADHPSNRARTRALITYLRRNSEFANWRSDERFATKL